MARILWIAPDGPGPREFELADSTPAHAFERVSLPELLNGPDDGAGVIFAEFPIQNWSPPELLEALRLAGYTQPVIIRDPQASTTDAVRLCRLGAFQCFGAAFSAEELTDCLELAAMEASARTRGTSSGEPWRNQLLGDSRAMRAVHQVIRTVAPRRCTVLLTGESGTGKELVARALHAASPRAHIPMVSVNCGALPEQLLESEMFGHVKGAFTGAVVNRVGRFEQANHGTIFLDEIGEMPMTLQVKLLRVLQEREFQRLGSSETVKVDVRVIAASNADLQKKVQQGTFRMDLFYRLNVVPLKTPALRERPEDIPMLVRHFVGKICRFEGMPEKEIGVETLSRLAEHAWPGNVRELENAVEMAVATSGDRQTLCLADFPMVSSGIRKIVPIAPSHEGDGLFPDGAWDFESAVNGFEQEMLRRALRKTSGNKTHAANLLGMKRTTLIAKLHGFETDVVQTAVKWA